jgi:hypothetical protein
MEPTGIDGAWIFTRRILAESRGLSWSGSGPGQSPRRSDTSQRSRRRTARCPVHRRPDRLGRGEQVQQAGDAIVAADDKTALQRYYVQGLMTGAVQGLMTGAVKG